jgi:hypothetical protein
MSNNKKQTAVELLVDQLEKHYVFQDIKNTTAFLRAKEMEKEQNKNYLKSYFEWHKSMGFVSHKPEDIIEFNETYGGKNDQ